MRISSLDSAYEGQPVARQTSGGGLWPLCARRGAITRNCSSCHFPAPTPLLLICPASVPSSSLFSALRFPVRSFLKRSFVGVFIAVYPRILSMGVARTSFKRRGGGRGKSKAVEQNFNFVSIGRWTLTRFKRDRGRSCLRRRSFELRLRHG